MARKNANSNAVIGPDDDDLDGQVAASGGKNGNENGTGTDTGNGTIDPASIAGGDDYQRDEHGNYVYSERTGKPLRKRGRKGGGSGGGTRARNSAGNSSLKDSIEMLAQVINIAHIGLSAATKCPELELESKESETLSKSIVNVLDQFDVKPDPRVTAIVGLVTTCGTIYGPRYIMITMRRKEEKKEKKDNVVDFNTNFTGHLNG